MSAMRQTINVVEAGRKVMVDPAAKAQAEAVRAQAVYAKIMMVVQRLAGTHYDFRSGWDQTWAMMIRSGLAKAKQEHVAEQQAEAEYYKEQGKSYTDVPFRTLEVLGDITARWWDQEVKDVVYQIEADAKYEYEDYQDAHPRTEQSDEMSALHDQLEMAKTIYYKGSDTIEGMTVVLNAIDNYREALSRYMHDGAFTRSAEDFIKRAFPAFMTICLYMGAKRG